MASWHVLMGMCGVCVCVQEGNQERKDSDSYEGQYQILVGFLSKYEDLRVTHREATVVYASFSFCHHHQEERRSDRNLPLQAPPHTASRVCQLGGRPRPSGRSLSPNSNSIRICRWPSLSPYSIIPQLLNPSYCAFSNSESRADKNPLSPQSLL